MQSERQTDRDRQRQRQRTGVSISNTDSHMITPQLPRNQPFITFSHTVRDRQTERQTGRQTDRDREIQRQTDRDREQACPYQTLSVI